MPEALYTNIVLSSGPCPVCAEASGKEMTLKEWAASKYGTPGSKKRYCCLRGNNCHCILAPVAALAQFPAIGEKVMLRGDFDTDIPAIIEIMPGETMLEMLLKKYEAKVGKIPTQVWYMSIKEAIEFLTKALK